MSCDIQPGDDWREQGWCCRACATLAHLEWCREHDRDPVPVQARRTADELFRRASGHGP